MKKPTKAVLSKLKKKLKENPDEIAEEGDYIAFTIPEEKIKWNKKTKKVL